MFDMFLLAIAIAAQSGGGGDGQVAQSAPAVTTESTGLAAPLQAEPQTPTGKFTTAAEVKPILSATRGNWVAVRDFNGQDLLYVTHLLTWRCGLVQLKIGLNGAEPQVWPLPECHMDQPMPGMMLETDGLPYRSFEQGSIQRVEVQITYDDLSTDMAVFDRAQVLMP